MLKEPPAEEALLEDLLSNSHSVISLATQEDADDILDQTSVGWEHTVEMAKSNFRFICSIIKKNAFFCRSCRTLQQMKRVQRRHKEKI